MQMKEERFIMIDGVKISPGPQWKGTMEEFKRHVEESKPTEEELAEWRKGHTVRCVLPRREERYYKKVEAILRGEIPYTDEELAKPLEFTFPEVEEENQPTLPH